jgi:hypothetical protein
MSSTPRKNIFEDLNTLDDSMTAAQSADALIYGDADAAKVLARSVRNLRATPLDIRKIRPDSLQPRRAVPSELRAYWRNDPKRTELLFERWLDAIAEERGGSQLVYKDILEGKETSRGKQVEAEVDNPEEHDNTKRGKEATRSTQIEAEADTPEHGPLASAFLKLVELAASIKRDGLTNPITVAEDRSGYIIETGERRWLAFHLLKMLYGEADWGEIPARQVKEVSVWRQASENNARDDLNAISKARQLALLLMAIHGWDKFQPIENFQHEREFYAQVADGHTWRIPKGFGEQLLNAMDLSSSSHLRRYRAILRVDNGLWDSADDNDWSERFIRDKETATKEAIMNGDQGHTIDSNQPPLPQDKFLATRKHYAKMLYEIAKVGQIAAMGEISGLQRLQTEGKIRELREWLIQQEKLINSK